jgi:hypothetical protein
LVTSGSEEGASVAASASVVSVLLSVSAQAAKTERSMQSAQKREMSFVIFIMLFSPFGNNFHHILPYSCGKVKCFNYLTDIKIPPEGGIFILL